MNSAFAIRVAATTFAAITIALHLLRREISPLRRGVSNYAVGPYGWLMTLGFVSLAVGVGLMANEFASWWLWAAAAGMAIVAATPTTHDARRTPSAYLHQTGGFIFFTTIAIGALVDRPDLPAARLVGITVGAFLAGFAVPRAALVRGALQRLAFVAILIYIY